MSRLAWFSPAPPSTSGIAAYSAELLPLLTRRGHVVDTFTDTNAHDFVWKQRRNAYDLTVFHMGNAQCHDYMWAYLFRYPGLVVLHDAQLHQARALFLTKRWKPRRDDYLAEFRANHPEAPADAGELVAAGLGGSLYHHWPLVRLVMDSARMTVVHNARLRDELSEKHPGARIDAIEMGVRDPGEQCEVRSAECGVRVPGAESEVRVHSAECDVRAAARVPREAILLAAFGGITPEKRIGPIIRALSAVAERQPLLHFLLVGSPASHYDVMEDAARWGVADRMHVAGFVRDEELSAYLQAADICACLRWPSNRETSASWLRCLAAGRATMMTDLSHLGDIPTVDPRGWRVLDAIGGAREPVAVSIDLLDEEHSLQLAIERLAVDAPMRERLGRAGRAWYEAHHRLEPMADAYERIIATAAALPAPRVALPAHLTDDSSHHARMLADSIGVSDRLVDVFGT
ncbi:MAG: glycosyltransferase family 4 protein [Planctomycetota bacterium]|nr:glycosyltransferase family 4 protein [Planctomycetota bacterium]